MADPDRWVRADFPLAMGNRTLRTAMKTIAVVTGASRGAGRGIAVALGSHGCTVYLTGRSENTGDSPLPGTIHETAAAVTAAGGKGIAVRVDHANDGEVKGLFDLVRRDDGRLDILVNNACSIHDAMMNPVNFWEKPLGVADMLQVGLRSSYVASYYAAPLMVEQRRGLVIFTSASGAVHYVFGPAYGAHKAGMDKFAADMAVDFRPFGVSAVSIWMGVVLTERVQQIIDRGPELAYLADIAETPEFTGHVIAALASDPDLLDVSGRTLIGAEVARQYGITDRDGRRPPSVRELMSVQPATYHGRIHR
jgi:NAD(P)-dependent dehydrogenase (short-subunit alcohol dehydrogenase family)